MSPAAARAATRMGSRSAATATARNAVPVPVAAPAAPRRRPAAARPAVRPAARQGRRLSFGVFWIGVAGVLLAGVVAVHVMVLRQNVELDHASRDRVKLQAENANLSSLLSASISASRIEGLAQRSLGLQSATPEATTYIDLGSRK
jgi:cell division protein FtsL